MSCRRCVAYTLVAVAVVVAAGVGLLYRSIVSGGSVARDRAPPGAEIALAQWLLHRSVPAAQRALKNPADPAADGPDVRAGRTTFRDKCEICHAYDGSGKTAIGGAEYPHAPDLRTADVQAVPDGELFYHIAHGIRHTGMPGWGLPERRIWQLVAYLRNLPKVATLGEVPAEPARQPPSASAQYVGSGRCKGCHENIYARWSKTRMANVIRDPAQYPDAITPDLDVPDPLVKFNRSDVAFVYGSKWKQRYFRRVGDDYFPLPVQWDIRHKAWKPYHAADGTDWWTKFYPSDNSQRPTGPLCDGCHSVNYDIATKQVTEWNVGCERCHGPGSEHLALKGHGGIVNPAGMDRVQANDVCIQCHSQGQPVANPIKGQYYDWPVGYNVGQGPLRAVWKLEDHKLGETNFMHFADGTAHKNRMQGNDFVQSLMYARGVTCFSCHDVHGTANDAVLWKPAERICLDCHGPNTPNGPHAATIEQHTHHKPDSPGSRCVECHMPPIAKTIADVNVRSHTFHFVTPAKTAADGVPNACNVCHKDKTVEWARTALRAWADRSPWRMEQ
ncbi:MAG: cytochrome c3 family protein [Betaproteobacteria bacterium]